MKGENILSNNKEQEILKIEVTSKEQLDELYNCSALTFTGVSAEEKGINDLVDWIKDYSEVSNPLPINIISGKVMNQNYGLTGSNAYHNDLTIISIKLNDIKNIEAITIPRFEVGGRWFDDIVDNNAIREKHKKIQKPKCALIGEDGNIFNLMGIASRTLKNNGMREEATEMCNRITSEAKSYDEALMIIDEYVEITSREDIEEEGFENEEFE
jgi:hypothetical protein